MAWRNRNGNCGVGAPVCPWLGFALQVFQQKQTTIFVSCARFGRVPCRIYTSRLPRGRRVAVEAVDRPGRGGVQFELESRAAFRTEIGHHLGRGRGGARPQGRAGLNADFPLAWPQHHPHDRPRLEALQPDGLALVGPAKGPTPVCRQPSVSSCSATSGCGTSNPICPACQKASGTARPGNASLLPVTAPVTARSLISRSVPATGSGNSKINWDARPPRRRRASTVAACRPTKLGPVAGGRPEAAQVGERLVVDVQVQVAPHFRAIGCQAMVVCCRSSTSRCHRQPVFTGIRWRMVEDAPPRSSDNL